MTDAELLQIIEKAAREGVTTLDLSGKGLRKLPPEIGQLTNLQTLHLSNNQLSQIPPTIRRLTNLQNLYFYNNKLTQLPPEIGQLTNLQSLHLSNNKLSQLPPEIRQLTNLQILYLYNNKLKQLPPEIGQLTNLQSLHLSNNKLSQLPPEIGKLSNLQSLGLPINQLSQLPPEFGKLSNLQSLDLGYNKLSQLPLEFGEIINLKYLDFSNNRLSQLSPKFGQLTNLKYLDLSNNKLSQISPKFGKLTNLQTLDLSNNYLSQLPPEFGKLTNLQTLELSGNPIEEPPPEILQRGTPAIVNYLRQKLEAEQDTIYEAKLIIVGEGEAGKTTLVNKINDPAYPCPNPEDSTQGIDVKEWHFTQDNGKDFRVNIWDFGGQEIYHATHQFFLTKRSLYALVADSRKEQPQLDYWLQIVELLSEKSPLLIVENEKDNRPVQINESQIRGRFHDSLKEIIITNFADNNRGLDETIKNIKHYITSLPHVGSKLPKTWTRVREVLEKDGRNYISLDEYLRICDNNGFKRRDDALQLSQFLHDIGVILHFQDDITSLLYKTVILKPAWGTDAVYKVLDNTTVKQNQGRFTNANLSNIWRDQQYENIQGELLELMRKFKLCYQLPGTYNTYIAPQLLDTNESNYNWNDNYNLILRYEYEFMPKGIITRFIVEMHRYIDEPKVWRSGVILKREDTFAEVIETYNKREIKIRLRGSNKRGFLAVITDKIDEIHRTYHRLRVQKLIPCNCPVCKNTQDPYPFKLEELQKRRNYGKSTIECGKAPFHSVSVQGLIDDIINVAKDRDFENMTVTRNKIFISYSHRDREWLDKLQIYLSPLQRSQLVDSWDDTRIRPGMKWREEITKALDSAKIAILLVSSNFFGSDFITKNELPPLLRKAKAEGALILAIILDPCQAIFNRSELAEYQTVNKPSTPLSGMDDNDRGECLNKLVERIYEVIEEKTR